MKKYKFPMKQINGVTSHIDGFGATILTMTPDNEYYIIDLDIAVEQDQYDHLLETYGFEEVV